jgi:hypothetical protein
MADEQQDATYEAPVVEDLMVEHGPAGVEAGPLQQTPVA